MKQCLLYLIFGLCISMLLPAQELNDKALWFNEQHLLERAKILSSENFEGRCTDTQGNAKARAYIISQFVALGVEGLEGAYEQEFSFKYKDESITGTNILAEIKGKKHPETYMVISAHYDHLGIQNNKVFNGADDNASGVSALISFAEYLSQHQPNYSVIFAAFDAEEIGLEGAKHFVKALENRPVLVNINLDMIGRSASNELYVVGARYTEELEVLIDDFNPHTSVILKQGHDGTDDKLDWTSASDHKYFHQKGIPFLYFGNEDHEAYHTPEDDFEDLTKSFYINATQTILMIVKEIDKNGL